MGGSRRHFCCCIPVRFAVFTSSLLLFLSAGFAAAVMFYLIWAINNDPSKLMDNGLNVDVSSYDFSKGVKIGIIIFGVIFSIISISSLFGFIGAIIRNVRMVRAYSTMVFIAFVFSCAGTGFFLYAIYSKNTFIKCVDNSGNTIDCNSVKTSTKIWTTVVQVVSLLWELYFCLVVRRYVDQLEDEQSYKNDFGLNKKTTSSYYPHQPLDTNHGLLAPQGGSYPYTDQSHSYGKTNQ